MIKKIKELWMDPKSRKLSRRIVKEHISKYRIDFLKAVLLMIVSAVATAAIPYLMQPVFDEVFQNQDSKLLWIVSGAVLSTFIIKGFSSYGQAVIMTNTGQRIVCDIQNRLLKHLLKSDLSLFQSRKSGDMISRFTNDIQLLRHSASDGLVGFGRDFFTFIFLIILMFYRDWILAISAIIIIPCAIIPVANLGRRMKKVSSKTQESVGQLTFQLSQLFQGIRIVKAYTREKYEENRIIQATENIYKNLCRGTKVRSLSAPIVESFAGISITCIILYGGYQVINQGRTTGEFISFITALIMVYEPIKRLGKLNSTIQEGIAAASRVFEVIDEEKLIFSPKNPKKLNGDINNLKFNNVYFSYADGTEAIKNLSLEINKGNTVAFVGSSGSGKSTLINLIPRFFDVSNGEISINGINVKDLSIKELRSKIALVSQETMLFDESVFKNISYGLDGASYEDVIYASKKAAAHEFIMELPNGYDTVVGEMGFKVSGGQRQRISIARAFLKNAPIILLDEATSALDNESEKKVQSALDELIVGRTTILVAHRLTTIKNSDKIYVMNNGVIAESGNHDDLIERNGIYANLWNCT